MTEIEREQLIKLAFNHFIRLHDNFLQTDKTPADVEDFGNRILWGMPDVRKINDMLYTLPWKRVGFWGQMRIAIGGRVRRLLSTSKVFTGGGERK